MGGMVRKKDKEAGELKEALAELQEREKQLDPSFKPIKDFAEEIKNKKPNAQ